jgi:hypothetical protein
VLRMGWKLEQELEWRGGQLSDWKVGFDDRDGLC